MACLIFKSKEELLSVIEEHKELKIENEEYIKQLDLIQNMLNGKEKELSGFEAETTNNRMEITAVIKALEALKESCEVNLYTD